MKPINLSSIAILPAIDTVNNIVLVANTAQTVDLSIAGEKGATHVIIGSVSGGVLVRMDGGDASVPRANVTDGTGVIVDPVVVSLAGLSKMSIVSATAQIVSLAFVKGF